MEDFCSLDRHRNLILKDTYRVEAFKNNFVSIHGFISIGTTLCDLTLEVWIESKTKGKKIWGIRVHKFCLLTILCMGKHWFLENLWRSLNVNKHSKLPIYKKNNPDVFRLTDTTSISRKKLEEKNCETFWWIFEQEHVVNSMALRRTNPVRLN